MASPPVEPGHGHLSVSDDNLSATGDNLFVTHDVTAAINLPPPTPITPTSQHSNAKNSPETRTNVPDDQEYCDVGNADVQIPNTNAPQEITAASKESPGRLEGSKNMPKTPSSRTRVSVDELPVNLHFFEVSDGCCVISSLLSYTRRQSRGVSILSSTGLVINPAFDYLTPQGSRSVSPLNGIFEIASLTGTIFSAGPVTNLGFYFTGPNGQVMGERIMGPLIAAGLVYVVAATFKIATVYKLSSDNTGNDHGGGTGAGGSVSKKTAADDDRARSLIRM